MVFGEGAKAYYSKFTINGSQGPAHRQLGTLLLFLELVLVEKIRGPRLYAYVQSEGENDQIHGYLLTHIKKLGTLHRRAIDAASSAMRKKWYEDIESMLKMLHDAGLVWGDAKADRVLVDTNYQVWMVDCGWGYTPGWVDLGKMETVEGDPQGLAKSKSIFSWM